MLVPGDLGFPGLILIFFFFISPIVSLVIRRKWRISEERRKEIMRLVAMAAEEAERAELEAAVEYGVVSVVRQYQCALCFSPTTTRCSRCKAVRYCSGKCQIIHWRRGHKKECRPASPSMLYNGPHDFDGNALLQGERHDIPDNGFEMEVRCEGGPNETSVQEPASSESSHVPEILGVKDHDKVGPLSDALGADIISDSSSTISSISKSNITNGLEDVPVSSTADREVGPLVDDIPPAGHETIGGSNGVELMGSAPLKISSLDESVSSSSRPSKLKKKTPSCSGGVVDSVSTSSSGLNCNGSDISEPSMDHSCSLGVSLDPNESAQDVLDKSTQSSFSEGGSEVLSDSGNSLHFSFNLSQPVIPISHSECSEPKILMSDVVKPVIVESKMHTSPSEKMMTDAVTLKSLPRSNSRRSASENSKSRDNSLPLHSKGVISSSSRKSDDHPSSVTGERSISDMKFSKADSVPVAVTGERSISDMKFSKADSVPVAVTVTGERSISDMKFSKAHSVPVAVTVTGERSISDMKFSKADSVPVLSAGSSKISSSSQSASNGLKVSVQKVVQQFKGSKLAKHYPLGFGSDIAGKHNYKMLFPYELFVKLYNKDKAELIPSGLTNCGNSCYANAVLQCLAFTRPLTAFLLQGLHSKACPKKERCFTCEFESLILKAKEGKSPLSPIGILSQLQSIGSHLAHGREEDAHEFLRYAIDKMQEVCLKEAGINVLGPLAEETTLIGLIFGGYLRSKIKCMKCRGKSEKHERMMDLSVEIQGDIGTLEEALGQFTATEILDGENKYYCSRCKSCEKAKKKLTILEAPNVLTIALKRFQTGKFGKLNKAVRFPEILNLAPYTSGTSSPIYSLYAVVVHLDVMNAAFSGHYVCYVKNSQGKWFKVDDSTVKPVELERVLSKEAYMLLYARCSPRAPGLIRNAMLSTERIKRSIKCIDAVSSSQNGQDGKSTGSRSKPSCMVPNGGSSAAHSKHEDCPFWINSDHSTANFESFESVDRRYHFMHRIPKVDSSSDNSSLFSCSDEGSCSTESNRDSISADESIIDHLFSWNNSPVSVWDESTSSSPSSSHSRSSPLSATGRHESGFPETSGYQPPNESDGIWMRVEPQESSRSEGGLVDKQQGNNVPYLYFDTSKQQHCRKLTNRCSSCKETDSRLGWGNSLDATTGVSLRRSIKETTQSFF